MSFVYFNTPNGKAYFEETPNGLMAVADNSVIKKLKGGQLAASEKKGFNNTFANPMQSSLPKVEAPQSSLPETRKPTNLQAFSNALNTAIELGRKKRNAANLDYLGGVIPKGAVSASPFTGLLSNLNTAFSKESERLYEGAINAAEAQNKMIADEANNLNDLAMKLIDAGVSGDAIKAIKATGSLEAALPAAADALAAANKGKKDIRQIGNKLIAVDEEGNIELLYNAGEGTSTEGSITTPTGKIPREQINATTQIFNSERGSDGYTNSATYAEAYNAWLSDGNRAEDFFAQFDPNIYVNPNDSSVPPEIKRAMKKSNSDPVDAIIDEAIKSYTL